VLKVQIYFPPSALHSEQCRPPTGGTRHATGHATSVCRSQRYRDGKDTPASKKDQACKAWQVSNLTPAAAARGSGCWRAAMRCKTARFPGEAGPLQRSARPRRRLADQQPQRRQTAKGTPEVVCATTTLWPFPEATSREKMEGGPGHKAPCEAGSSRGSTAILQRHLVHLQ
jgi:hypothetical protein